MRSTTFLTLRKGGGLLYNSSAVTNAWPTIIRSGPFEFLLDAASRQPRCSLVPPTAMVKDKAKADTQMLQQL